MTPAQQRFAMGDAPTPAFIGPMRQPAPVEPEVDALRIRKMEPRSGPEYHRISKSGINRCLEPILADSGLSDYRISDHRGFTGGVSTIQLGFTLEWADNGTRRSEQMVVRMGPAEGSNTTSRLREFELLRALAGTVPVPAVYWLAREATWCPTRR